jgi:hypothetical protein
VFAYSVSAQGPGSPSTIIDAIHGAASRAKFNRVRASYAFASSPGAFLLAETLRDALEDWERATKRWMVSFDWGHTQPAAVEYLLSLPKSEVRVPNADQVIRSRLMPRVCFHPKTIVLDKAAGGAGPPVAAVIGSGNMTVSGLRTGYETASAAVWTSSSMNAAARAQLAAVLREARDTDRVWALATPVDADLIARYAAVRKKRPTMNEDASKAATTFSSSYGSIDLARAAVLASATNLWVEIDYVVRNRGAGREGNQVDLPRGTRTFFGFPAATIPRNSPLGEIVIAYGTDRFPRNMRYGNNQMDKLDLPIPGDEGPPSYLHTTLRFERIGPKTFRLHVGTTQEIAKWKALSRRRGTSYAMRSGREYGVF